jgi:hypothetical protein
MKTTRLFSSIVSGLVIATVCARAGTVVQTFETGEDTSDWGSTWSGGAITTGFLDSSLGGQNAGLGLSSGQNFSRSFQNNTAGISVSGQYYGGLYVQVNTETNNTPNSGELDIIDGSFGSSAVDIQVRANGSGVLGWAAKSNGSYLDFGLNLNLGDPYRILFGVDPTTSTYDATVQAVDTFGNVLQSATLTGLQSDPNVFNNHQNGTLLFYLQASAGNASVLADNLTISSLPISTTPTPEPSTVALVASGFAAVLYLKRSRLPI